MKTPLVYPQITNVVKFAFMVVLAFLFSPFTSQAQVQLEVDGTMKITGADSMTTGVFLVVDQDGIRRVSSNSFF